MRGWTVGSHVACDGWKGAVTTRPEWLNGVLGEQGRGWLDVSCAVDNDGMVSLAVVNIHEEKDFETEIAGLKEGQQVQVLVVTGDHVGSKNTREKEEVTVTESTWDGKGKFTFKRLSLTMLRWNCGLEVDVDAA